ncbi:uncharacterized protein LOC120142879 [Hibiscus syriacus]|uniref:uncharacterized protein LOC120142879 n=1 Tax=Hibiscus syriacus TaxID=106335 RepID=UPI001923DA03|nr:uncharacterized protein LOC120142879 [Hibiscus syriacus]
MDKNWNSSPRPTQKGFQQLIQRLKSLMLESPDRSSHWWVNSSGLLQTLSQCKGSQTFFGQALFKALVSRTGLSYLASAIGNPISLDSITASKTRLEYARICVEIGITDEIPKFVNVILKDGRSTSISVKVPWLPLSCKKCKVYGHSEKKCFSNAAPVMSQVWIKKRALSPNSKTSTSRQNEALQDPIEHATMVQNKKEVGPQNVPVPTKTTPIVEENHTNVVQTQTNSNPEGIQDNHFPTLKVSIIEDEPTTPDDTDEHSSVTEDQTRKIRTASLGVSALLNDLKKKKKQYLERARSSTVDGFGGASSSPAQ